MTTSTIRIPTPPPRSTTTPRRASAICPPSRPRLRRRQASAASGCSWASACHAGRGHASAVALVGLVRGGTTAPRTIVNSRRRSRPQPPKPPAPTLADRERASPSRPYSRVRPHAAGGPARRHQEVQGRRLRARHPRSPTSKAPTRVWSLRGQRQVPPRHRRLGPDRRQPGRHGRVDARQRRLQGR